MIRLIFALTLFFTLPAQAEETVVAGLSQNQVAITATFVGSEILIYGAVKRDEPMPDTSDLGVVVVVEGPSHEVTVRRKEKRVGIWVNTDAVRVDAAPSFYAVATSAPFDQIISQTENVRYHISIPQSIRLVGESEHALDIENFADAVIRIRTAQGLYKFQEGDVDLSEDTLFSTRIQLPANLTEGEYKARIYLTRSQQVTANYETGIHVEKVGLERWIYSLAHEKPIVYGVMSLVIAVFAGWSASAAFRVLLRS